MPPPLVEATARVPLEAHTLKPMGEGPLLACPLGWAPDGLPPPLLISYA